MAPKKRQENPTECKRCQGKLVKDPHHKPKDAVLWMVHSDTGFVICKDQMPDLT